MRIRRSIIFLWVFLLTPQLAFADAGLPLIMLTWPGLFFGLIPIVIIEALVFQKYFKMPFMKVLWPSVWANLATTFIGFPLTWVVLLALQMAIGFTLLLGFQIPSSIGWAWVGPTGGMGRWVFWFWLCVGLIPAFLVSVFVEARIVRKNLPALTKILVWDAVIMGNLITYALLLCYAVIIVWRWRG